MTSFRYQKMSAISEQARQAASPFFIFGLMLYLYNCLQKYDWGHPFIKLFCFVVVFLLIVFLRSRTHPTKLPAILARLEFLVLTIVLVIILTNYGKIYGPDLSHPPYVDIGYTTVKATSMLFHDGKNPYTSQYINARDDLLPQYRGFHYGPLMLIGYLPSLLSPTWGYKLASLGYFLVSALLLCSLLELHKIPPERRLCSIAFVLCLFFLPERFWYELFRQGANDIFPVALLLASLLALQRQKYFLTGLFLGLSFSAKFSPAIFLLMALVRKDLKISAAKGFCLGLIPLLIFVVWDTKGLINNAFRNRGVALSYDSTSLYSETALAFHFIFPVLLLLAVAYSVYRNFRTALDYENALVTLTLLLIIGEVTFKQMHANHLIWFYPLFALILERHRYQFFTLRDEINDLACHEHPKISTTS